MVNNHKAGVKLKIIEKSSQMVIFFAHFFSCLGLTIISLFVLIRFSALSLGVRMVRIDPELVN